MASFAGSSKDTVADLLVDKSASPPPGAKPAKAPDTEKKHYQNNNDGETMEALLEGPLAASRIAASPGMMECSAQVREIQISVTHGRTFKVRRGERPRA